MEGRGRTSSAALAVVQPLTVVERPVPPDHLRPEEQQEWARIAAGMPADWFTPETYPLLEQYCRHVVSARHVAQAIRKYERDEENFSVRLYDRLLAMQEREGRAIGVLATRMRLTQQSRYDKSRRRGSDGFVKPWE